MTLERAYQILFEHHKTWRNVAAALKVTTKTLERWRIHRDPPGFVKDRLIEKAEQLQGKSKHLKTRYASARVPGSSTKP